MGRLGEGHRPGTPRRHWSGRLPAALSAQQDFNRKLQLLRRGLARQGLAEPSIEVAVGSPDESVVLVEKRSQPGMIVFAKKVRDDHTAGDATVEQMIG
jgi:hypothetical protein